MDDPFGGDDPVVITIDIAVVAAVIVGMMRGAGQGCAGFYADASSAMMGER